MSKLPSGVKIGLIINSIFFAAGLIDCIFIFFDEWLLMASIVAISFVVSLVINEIILKSFKNGLSKSKECWCAFDWLISYTLWMVGVHLSRPINHVLFFVGFGYIAASLLVKLSKIL